MSNVTDLSAYRERNRNLDAVVRNIRALPNLNHCAECGGRTERANALCESCIDEVQARLQALREPPRASHDEHPLTIWEKE